jgi:RecJ-like exonuclease
MDKCETCRHCNGTGKIVVTDLLLRDAAEQERYMRMARRNAHPCPFCEGTGMRKPRETAGAGVG